MFCALTNAAKHGVFFKGADCLETLAKVNVMAFDKTGTVTKADFEVTEFRSLLDDISLNTLLYWVSCIQSKSSHPIAAALIDFAQSHSVQPKANEVEEYQNFPGEGIYGRINGKEIYIGNLKISARAGCNSVPKLEGDEYEGKSVGYVFLGSTPVGIFCLADVCRIGAKEALKELKSMGIKIVMLTGDCIAAAKHAEDQLGGALEVVHAELLPEDKATIIKDFQKVARTAMIGDGINDAPALTTADIGISMGISGSALATETGHPVVWAAVLADVGTCLLVIINSMLLLRERTKGPMEYCKSSASSCAQKAEIKSKCCGSDLLESGKPCCGEVEPLKCHDVPILSVENSGPLYNSDASTSSSFGDCRRLGSNEKQSCCGNGKKIQKVKCSNTSVANCCETINIPSDKQSCCWN